MARTSDHGPVTKFADFDLIQVGNCATLSRRFTEADIDAFAQLSGDYNPLHMDKESARKSPFRRRVVHGILSASAVSSLIGMKLPGPGALWVRQSFEFLFPVLVGDEILFRVEVKHKSQATRTISIYVEATNQRKIIVLKGEGTVMILEEPKQQTQSAEQRSDLAMLRGQVVLVTGSSRGIGAAIATVLGRSGASVIVNYQSSGAPAQKVVDLIRESGSNALSVQADVADRDSVNDMVRQAKNHFGRSITILVNNASAQIRRQSFMEMSWTDLEHQYNSVIRGAFNCCQAVLPDMLQSGEGRIINIGSAAAWGVPPAQDLANVLAKSALASLTRCLAVELGPKGVHVNIVSPGMTETDRISDVPLRTRKVLAMQTPLRRLGTPEDVARIVLMLCSPAGDYLNGIDIPVTGGGVM